MNDPWMTPHHRSLFQSGTALDFGLRPEDLRPFPTHIAVSYEGHEGMIRSVAVEATGDGERILTVSAPPVGAQKKVTWIARCSHYVDLGWQCVFLRIRIIFGMKEEEFHMRFHLSV